MDFTMGLPTAIGKMDAIWVIVDQLTKSILLLLGRIREPRG